MATAKKTPKEVQKAAPRVRVRSAGRISGTLEGFVALYRQKFEDRDVVWVYNPEHKPELSNVTAYKADGFEIVTYGDLELEGSANKPIRVGDVILMSNTREAIEEMRAETAERVADQKRRVEREFYEEQRALDDEARHGEGPRTAPIGRALITEREYEYDVEQRSSEE